MKYYEGGAGYYDVLHAGNAGDVRFYLDEASGAREKVLEIGCGNGRIFLGMLRRGIDAYGLDKSAAMLDSLKGKAKKCGLDISGRIKQADMRAFSYPFKFGLIIIPYRAFLHMETREDQKKCLRNVLRHLEKGGRLALNFFDPRPGHLAMKRRRMVWKKKGPEGGRLRIEEEYRYDLVNQYMHAHHRILNPPEGAPRGKVDFSTCYIFPREFMNMLELCGFRRWKLYGGFDYKPYTKHGQELVWIAYG